MKKVLILACLVFCLTGLFPPWVHTVNLRGASPTTYPAGYYLIFDPPARRGEGGRYGVAIDVPRLLIQWAVLIVAVGGYVYLKGRAHALKGRRGKD